MLYGAGYCGHETLQQLRKRNIEVSAICDDVRIGQELDGFPITDICGVNPSKNLIIFVTSGFNEAMFLKLKKLNLIDYYEEADFGRFEPEKENYEFFEAYGKEVEIVYDLLKDDFSKRLFLNLINYRISRNSQYMKGMMERTPQYFPERPNLRMIYSDKFDKHVFLDLGAYNGDSIRGFLKYVHGVYDSIIAVEASERNYELLLKNCKGLNNIDCINIGISNEKKTIAFNISDAKNSFASETGDNLLNVDSVDNILQGRQVSFIKMDIEGAEFDAVRGAKNTIENCKPILAVSVYHLTEDLFRIALEVEKIAPGSYDYYLRHYSPTMIETILYAIPQKYNSN